MKRATSLLMAAGLAAAQHTEIHSVLFPFGVDNQAVAASIISAGPTATDYLLTCPTGTPSDECGLGEGVALLYGPETVTYAMSFETYSMSAACTLDTAKDLATCSGDMTSGTVTELYTESDIDFSAYIRPITVTAGFDGEGAAAATTTAAPTGEVATSSSTGGVMPRVTQNAVVLGAAVVVVGGAAMLI